MKNPNTKIIVEHILAFLVLCCVCSLVNAQSCETMLDDVRKYCSQGQYSEAQKMRDRLLKRCPEYQKDVEKVLTEYRNKSNQNKPKPQQTSSGYIPQEIQAKSISYFGTYYGAVPVMEFDADGGCVNPNITVNYYGKMEIIEDIPNWLSIRQQGSTFIVTCSPNNTSEDRLYEFQFMLGEGMDGISDTIRVYQDSKTAPKRPSRPNPTAQPNPVEPIQENRSITVKVTFETGKATPRFENFGDLLVLLEKNKDIGLQIEVPWCNNQKSEVGFKKYPEALIKKRIKNITDHFGKSGIAKDRISCSINYESNTECDCAYVKSVDLSGGSSR